MNVDVGVKGYHVIGQKKTGARNDQLFDLLDQPFAVWFDATMLFHKAIQFFGKPARKSTQSI